MLEERRELPLMAWASIEGRSAVAVFTFSR